MIDFSSILTVFNIIFGNNYLILLVELLTFTLKMFFLIYVMNALGKKALQPRLIFLLISISCSAITNFAWIIRLISLTTGAEIPGLKIISQLAWAFYIIHYQYLTIFLEFLIKKSKRLNRVHLLFAIISTCISILVLGMQWIMPTYNAREIYGYIVQYIYIMMPSSLFILLFESYKNKFPAIVRRQFNTIVFAVIVPGLIFDFLQIYPLNKLMQAIATNNISFVGLSTSISIFFLFYCYQTILKLRFLNLKPHIEKGTQPSIDFIERFRDILEELSKATQLEELTYITKHFFEKAFALQPSHVHLIIKSASTHELLKSNIEGARLLEEAEETLTIERDKILFLYDIEFNQFYADNTKTAIAFSLMERFDAEIIIPVHLKNSIVGYIIIQKDPAKKRFYGKIDADQMILFINYLANVINFINQRKLTTIIRNEKELKEELYLKHQEINKYKESLRYFLKHSNGDKFGIIFYKNRRFIIGNPDAQEMIPYNINQIDGPLIVKRIKQLVKSIQQTGTVQHIFTLDHAQHKIKVTGIPIHETNHIVLILTNPDISDLLKDQVTRLKDPSYWDYLLYLETTEAGCFINKLIPGNSETFLNFKIELLKIALSKKAILLQGPEEDLTMISTIIHHLSLKDVIHTLDLKSPEKHNEVGIKLFGINPLFAQHEEGLLKKLDGIGTLFIQNIHFLSLETQHSLANFLRYGFYSAYKSDQKIGADIRIICSTNSNLQLLVQQGLFSKELYNELIETSLKIPSMLLLDEKEVEHITENLTNQALQQDTLKEVFELNEKEKMKLVENRPASLADFKKRIEHILIQKSKKHPVYEKTAIDPTFNLEDPVLFNAAKLGKKALKDPDILSALWGKFKNQNKIATFLGVNRSSVSRRLKEYKISIE